MFPPSRTRTTTSQPSEEDNYNQRKKEGKRKEKRKEKRKNRRESKKDLFFELKIKIIFNKKKYSSKVIVTLLRKIKCSNFDFLF